MIYNKNSKLELKATADSGSSTLTIQTYEWTINGKISSEKTDTIIINTNTLNSLPEKNIISLRVQNSNPCNKWSEYITKEINVQSTQLEVTTMEQTFTVVVDKPKVSVDVIIQMNATVIVNVKNQIGTPVQGLSVKIGDISATTDASGVATLENVSYGNPQSGTVTF